MVCKGHCEIDKFADRSYRAIHDIKEDEWYAKDITEVNPADLPRVNLWTGGFPCQDISVSGKRRGLVGERSALFFEITRLLEGTEPENRPEWIVLENVKNLFSVHRGWDFAAVLTALAEVGYCVEYGLLNSRFHGVPQNRERVYLVAHRHFGAGSGRKVFPVGAGDSKALVSLTRGRQGERVYDPVGVGCTLTSESGGFAGKTGLYFVDLCRGKPKLTETARCIKARYDAGVSNHSAENSGVFHPDPSEKTMRIKNATKRGYLDASYGDGVSLSHPGSNTRRGRVGKGYAQTLDTSCSVGTPDLRRGRIRRLTPRECWRLQGFSDEMFERAAAVNSDTQLYKQAGNSVTVPVVYAVGKRIVQIQTELDNEHIQATQKEA